MEKPDFSFTSGFDNDKLHEILRWIFTQKNSDLRRCAEWLVLELSGEHMMRNVMHECATMWERAAKLRREGL